MKARSFLVALAFAGLGCGDDAAPASSSPTAPGGPVVCEPGSGVVGDRCVAAGFVGCPDDVAEGGGACGASALECGPGTVAFYGKTECTPVGPGACPAGFARDASGFGCAAVVTSSTCTGATRPKLGETSCVPVGDCDAPFPPASATYFVDDSFTGGQIDSTHFATIQAAVAAAPTGATIAVDEGSYTAPVTLAKAVTLVGRCAEKVTLSGAGVATPGLAVSKKLKVGLSGMTITDFEVGVSAGGGADVALEALVIEGNRRIGILGADAGTRVVAKGVVVRGTLPDASGRFGHGAASGFESEITIEDSALLESGEIGASAQKDGKIAVVRSVVSGVTQRAGNNAYGWGVGTQTGGQATVTESAIFDTFLGGVVAPEAKTKVRLERSFIKGVRPGPTTSGGEIAAGAVAQGEGVLEIEGSTITDAARDGVFVSGATATIGSSVIRDLEGSALEGAGINVTKTSTVSLEATAIIASTASGILSAGKLDASDLFISDVSAAGVAARGTAKIERIVVSDLRPGKAGDEAFGAGLYADAAGSLEVTDAIVRQANGLGLLATGAGTKLTLLRAVVAATKSAGDASGYGVAGAKGAAITIEDAVVTEAHDIGVHISDPGTVAVLRGVSVLDTKGNGPEERGRSLNVQDGAVLELHRVRSRNGTQVGLDVVGEGARAVVEDSVLSGVAQTKRGFGHGVAVTQGGSLAITHSIISDNTGIGLVFSNASGSVAGSIVRGNPIGVHTQDGVSLIEAESVPAELEPLSVVFSTDTRFEENGSKIGAGDIPLPAPAKPVTSP